MNYYSDISPQAGGSASTAGGRIDHAGLDGLWGWASDAIDPGQPVLLRVSVDGAVVGEIMAGMIRSDLAAGLGFEFPIANGLSQDVGHVIRVQRVADGADLENSPWFVKPALLGFLDSATATGVRGWACTAGAKVPVVLELLDNGLPIARVAAQTFRQDVLDAGFGDGRHGFEVKFAQSLAMQTRHVIEVRRQDDGSLLQGGPIVIEPVDSFDPALERSLADALAGIADPQERSRALAIIVNRASRLAEQATASR